MTSDTDAEGDPPAVLEAASERFVGRRAELREISARAVLAASGRQQVVVIEGPPGIGKTALARRALALMPGFQQLGADCARGSAADQLAGQAWRTLGREPGTSRGELAPALHEMLGRGHQVAMALDNAQFIDAGSAAELSKALGDQRAALLI